MIYPTGTAIKADEDGPPKAVAGTSPAAKTSRLSPESEAVLLTLFGIQDMLGREDAQVLANQVLPLQYPHQDPYQDPYPEGVTVS